MWGNLISAGASLIGGWMNSQNQQAAQAQTALYADKQMRMQEEFAQKGIRWKVADAQKAGIHPLYALGAPTTSYSPQSVNFGADTSMGNALAAAGQDIGRAINSTRTSSERNDAFTQSVQAIQLESAKVDLDIKKTMLASAIAKNRDNATPPGPAQLQPGAAGLIAEDLSPDKRPVGLVQGTRIWTDPNTSNVDDFWQKRYGEPGEYIGAAATGWADLKHNFGNMSVGDMINRIDSATSISDKLDLVSWLKRNLPNFGRR